MPTQEELEKLSKKLGQPNIVSSSNMDDDQITVTSGVSHLTAATYQSVQTPEQRAQEMTEDLFGVSFLQDKKLKRNLHRIDHIIKEFTGLKDFTYTVKDGENQGFKISITSMDALRKYIVDKLKHGLKQDITPIILRAKESYLASISDIKEQKIVEIGDTDAATRLAINNIKQEWAINRSKYEDDNFHGVYLRFIAESDAQSKDILQNELIKIYNFFETIEIDQLVKEVRKHLNSLDENQASILGIKRILLNNISDTNSIIRFNSDSNEDKVYESMLRQARKELEASKNILKYSLLKEKERNKESEARTKIIQKEEQEKKRFDVINEKIITLNKQRMELMELLNYRDPEELMEELIKAESEIRIYLENEINSKLEMLSKSTPIARDEANARINLEEDREKDFKLLQEIKEREKLGLEEKIKRVKLISEIESDIERIKNLKQKDFVKIKELELSKKKKAEEIELNKKRRAEELGKIYQDVMLNGGDIIEILNPNSRYYKEDKGNKKKEYYDYKDLPVNYLIPYSAIPIPLPLIHFTILGNKVEVAKMLLAHPKIDVNIEIEGSTPILFAIHNDDKNIKDQNIEIVRFLLAHPKINLERNCYLHEAIENNKLLIFKELLKTKIDINAKDDVGNTPLHSASIVKDINVAIPFIEAFKGLKNLKVNEGNNNGVPPIFSAIVADEPIKRVEALIKLGANINVRGPKGNTLLFVVSEMGYVGLIEKVAGLGVDVNAKNDEGKTAIFNAVLNRKIEAVRKLIKLGLTVEDKDNNDQTPIFDAVKNQDVKTTRFLVEELNANIALKDKGGKSPLDFATTPEMINFLKEKLRLKESIPNPQTAVNSIAPIADNKNNKPVR